MRLYGGAARSEIPRLRNLAQELTARGWKPEAIEGLGIPALIRAIEKDGAPRPLRPLPNRR